MNTIIIAGFPGVGKSFCGRVSTDCLDADSSKFNWIYVEDGTRQPNEYFPTNYINYIKSKLGTVKYIFVSTHEEVLQQLINNKLYFVLVYPDKSDKEEYILRYQQRGSSNEFMQKLSDNWDKWINNLDSIRNNYCIKYRLPKDSYLYEHYFLYIRRLYFNTLCFDLYTKYYNYDNLVFNILFPNQDKYKQLRLGQIIGNNLQYYAISLEMDLHLASLFKFDNSYYNMEPEELYDYWKVVLPIYGKKFIVGILRNPKEENPVKEDLQIDISTFFYHVYTHYINRNYKYQDYPMLMYLAAEFNKIFNSYQTTVLNQDGLVDDRKYLLFKEVARMIDIVEQFDMKISKNIIKF